MRLRLDNVRLSFADLYTAKSKFNGPEKFSAVFLVDKTTPEGEANMKEFKAICRKLEAEKFDNRELPIDKLCVSDGNDKDYDGWENKIVFTAANAKRPKIVGSQNQAVAEGDAEAPYSGCFVSVILDVWPLTGQFGPRIVASLEAVQYRSAGEPFSAHTVDTDTAFEKVEDSNAETSGFGL